MVGGGSERQTREECITNAGITKQSLERSCGQKLPKDRQRCFNQAREIIRTRLEACDRAVVWG